MSAIVSAIATLLPTCLFFTSVNKVFISKVHFRFELYRPR